jgi:hypothetical protein
LLVRTRFTLGGLGVHLVWWPFFEIGDFLQQWRMLPGIKRRAEGLSGNRSVPLGGWCSLLGYRSSAG